MSFSNAFNKKSVSQNPRSDNTKLNVQSGIKQQTIMAADRAESHTVSETIVLYENNINAQQASNLHSNFYRYSKRFIGPTESEGRTTTKRRRMLQAKFDLFGAVPCPNISAIKGRNLLVNKKFSLSLDHVPTVEPIIPTAKRRSLSLNVTYRNKS